MKKNKTLNIQKFLNNTINQFDLVDIYRILPHNGISKCQWNIHQEKPYSGPENKFQ